MSNEKYMGQWQISHASLMTIAPDLLNICVALVEWCDKNQPAGEALYFVQQAREAIAKATKGQS